MLYANQDAMERLVPRGNPQASVTRVLETPKIIEFSTCLPSPHAYQVSSEVVLLRSL